MYISPSLLASWASYLERKGPIWRKIERCNLMSRVMVYMYTTQMVANKMLMLRRFGGKGLRRSGIVADKKWNSLIPLL